LNTSAGPHVNRDCADHRGNGTSADWSETTARGHTVNGAESYHGTTAYTVRTDVGEHERRGDAQRLRHLAGAWAADGSGAHHGPRGRTAKAPAASSAHR